MSFQPSDSISEEANLSRCEEILQYEFQNRDLLRRALTHSSIAASRLTSNERMEFLGDSVLGMVVCETLFESYPDYPEGELTRIKSSVVSRSTCARISCDMGLDDCLYLGKGLSNHGEIPESVVAGSFEGVVAAIYLDSGYESARSFLRAVLQDEIVRLVEQEEEENFKSVLQQLAQKDFQLTPGYRLLDEKGPDHSKCFKVSAYIGDEYYPAAWGNTKKEAEQHAAENAYAILSEQPAPHASDE
ncbi:MAG: ribonuclease III [Planctomycetaceae bacterium]|jgi:ribonuclease III|nr:ribonuclease III [Planctomycetaceae bacterium]